MAEDAPVHGEKSQDVKCTESVLCIKAAFGDNDVSCCVIRLVQCDVDH